MKQTLSKVIKIANLLLGLLLATFMGSQAYRALDANSARYITAIKLMIGLGILSLLLAVLPLTRISAKYFWAFPFAQAVVAVFFWNKVPQLWIAGCLYLLYAVAVAFVFRYSKLDEDLHKSKKE